MSQLIDDILLYSKLTREIPKKEHVDLNKVLLEIMADVNPRENIQITIENDLPVLICEKTHIVQIFQNLLSNAVKYLDKPKGHVKINCREQEGVWQFRVADNGPGIQQQHFERIFKMFQTLSSGEGTESSGIGLSVVKKITEMYGGNVWVESEVGKGSTFFFTLPKEMDIQSIEHQAAATS
jgi:signal transduction histidine kinase